MSVFLIEQTQAELNAVRQFQQHAELAGVRMKQFCAKRAEKEPEIKEGLLLDLRHQATRAEIKADRAQFDIELDMDALGDKDPEKKLFHVDCCFELEYILASGYAPTDNELAAFKKGNAVFHCWPYVREFVQNVTQRLGLTVPPIPLLRLQPKRLEARIARIPRRGKRTLPSLRPASDTPLLDTHTEQEPTR